MAHLDIHLFGGFQVHLDGQPLTQFESDKVRALLAYLAVERDRPHRREALAALLWPAWAEGGARANLRRALCDLRHVIGDQDATPAFLSVCRQTAGWNADSDTWCDAVTFALLYQRLRHCIALPLGCDRACEEEAAAAVALYQGRFLEGFFLHDSPAFDHWTQRIAERTRRQAATLLAILALTCAQSDRLPKALHYARRRAELEPWNEQAHRHLMRLLAEDGQRAAALHQYAACRQALDAELGVEPELQTQRLYQELSKPS